MKKALYLLLCINSTNDRTVPLHRSQSGSHSNLASRRESETSTISQSNSNTSLSSRLGWISNRLFCTLETRLHASSVSLNDLV